MYIKLNYYTEGKISFKHRSKSIQNKSIQSIQNKRLQVHAGRYD